MPTRAASPLAAASLAVLLAHTACGKSELAPDSRAASQTELESTLQSAPEPTAAQSIADRSISPQSISADPIVQAIVELAAIDSQVDDHVEVLAVDIGPRLTGSSQLAEAEQWAVERFTSWGLTTTREQWGEFPVAFDRGKASGQVIRPERALLEFTTWAWTPGTRGQDGLEAGGPIRGQALRYPTTAAELREQKPYTTNAWMMLPRASETPIPRPKSTLGQQIDRALERARIAGIVRPAGDDDDRLIRNHGDQRLDPANLPKRVEIHLRGDQHAALLDRIDAGEFVELEFGVGNRLLPGPVPVFNVIAELRGEALPDQRVIVGGHLDSWDGASGAVDNATGVATTMEAARLIAAACEQHGIRPKRTISFMLWSGEEQGLLGSKAYVEAHPELLEGISAVLVHDHGTNAISGIAVTPEMWATMAGVFEPVQKLAPDSMPFALRVVEALPWEPTDTTAFMHADVPGFYWDQSGRSDYDRYHHTQHDHVDAVIDEYQRHSALVIAIAAWNLAQLDAPIDRHNAFGLPNRMLGVALDDNVVTAIAADGVAAVGGVEVGDRIVEIDGIDVRDLPTIVSAIQRGGADKTVVVERPNPNESLPVERVELDLDWSRDPDERVRVERRAQRRARFGPELRPWDDEEQLRDE